MTDKREEFEQIDGIRVPKVHKIDKESPGRTLAKTISWRIVASITTFVIFYFATDGKIAMQALSAAVAVEVVAKMVIYFLHERAWANIYWGKYWHKNKLVRRIKLYYIRKRRMKQQK
jgi:uncharacterized membrane protein